MANTEQGNAERVNSDIAEQPLATLIESVGWGVFLIWFGVIFLANLSWSLGLIGFGVILLGTQLMRMFFALKVHRFGSMLGLLSIIGGVLRSLNFDPEKLFIPPWLIPALFVGVGLAVLVSALWPSRKP